MVATAHTKSSFSGAVASGQEELAWARAAVKGEPEAQRKIVSLVYEKIRKTVYYTVRDADWAEDISQNVMLKVLHSLNQFRGDSSLENWSSRIALNYAVRAIKKRQRRQELSIFILALEEGKKADDEADIYRIRKIINRLVTKLPEKQLTVVMLKHVHGHSIAEIALLLDVPENTVRDRLQQGKKTLKKAMSQNAELTQWFQGG